MKLLVELLILTAVIISVSCSSAKQSQPAIKAPPGNITQTPPKEENKGKSEETGPDSPEATKVEPKPEVSVSKPKTSKPISDSAGNAADHKYDELYIIPNRSPFEEQQKEKAKKDNQSEDDNRDDDKEAK